MLKLTRPIQASRQRAGALVASVVLQPSSALISGGYYSSKGRCEVGGLARDLAFGRRALEQVGTIIATTETHP